MTRTEQFNSLIKESGMTQKEVAEFLDVTREAVRLNSAGPTRNVNIKALQGYLLSKRIKDGLNHFCAVALYENGK